MRITKELFLFLFLVFCFSCEEHSLFINCPDCLAEEPLKINLEIKVDLYSGKPTLVKVYEGNLEDNVLYTSFYALSKSRMILVPINKKYTVTATYFIAPHYYIAVDSTTPRVVYEKERCSDPCYFVFDKFVDLTIKYTK
jgi:hypothetical protein